jgi:hypothetical protein
MQDGVRLVNNHSLRDIRHVGNVTGDTYEPRFPGSAGKAGELSIECDSSVAACYQCTDNRRSEKSAATGDKYAHLSFPISSILARKRRRE